MNEEAYAALFRPDSALLKNLDLYRDIVARNRPPATEVHKHNPENENCITKKSSPMKIGDKREAIKNTDYQERSVCLRIVLSLGPIDRAVKRK